MPNTFQKTILIVDDEPDITTFLSTFFQDNGFNTIIATTGKEAFELAVKVKPDLITLDITMPEESGVRALKEIQEHEATKNIPIIIITGISSDFKKFIYTRKQVHPPEDYFEKPIDIELLLKRVNELLGIKQFILIQQLLLS